MPRADYKRCRNCGGHQAQVGELSHTRLCIGCADVLMVENMDGIHERSGPAHERRRYGIALREFGPRIALAMKQAGVFGDGLLDDVNAHP